MSTMNGYLSGLAIGVLLMSSIAVVAPSAVADSIATDQASQSSTQF